LGLGWSGERRSRQHCYGCRRDESDLHHWAFLLRVKNQLGPIQDRSASPAVILSQLRRRRARAGWSNPSPACAARSRQHFIMKQRDSVR
jgi:hypothetical protein